MRLTANKWSIELKMPDNVVDIIAVLGLRRDSTSTAWLRNMLTFSKWHWIPCGVSVYYA